MNKLAATLAFVLLLALPLLAQQPASQEALLDQLVGKWVLQGAIAGRQVTHDVDAEWVLKRGYVRLHEVSRENDATGNPAYEAIIFINWDPRASEYLCLWLDSTANTGLTADGIAHGKARGDEIPFVFKDTGGGGIRNTFKFMRTTNTWEWAIDNEEAGKLKPFARVTLKKK